MRPKKCPECSEKYLPVRQMQPCCDKDECKLSFAIRHAEASRRRRRLHADRLERIAKAEERKTIKLKLDKLRPNYLENKAQQAINAYVRVRDHEDGCISCDKPASWNGQWHASHLKSRGANSFLRYNLWNLHKACSVCNNHKSGNVAEYERRLIQKIGEDRFDFIQNAPRSRRYEDEYLIRLAAVFRKKTRILKKRKGLA